MFNSDSIKGTFFFFKLVDTSSAMLNRSSHGKYIWTYFLIIEGRTVSLHHNKWGLFIYILTIIKYFPYFLYCNANISYCGIRFFYLSTSFFKINSKSLFQFFKRVDFYKHVSNLHTVHLKGIYTMLNVNEISRKQRK